MSRRSAAASVNGRQPKPLFTVLLGEASFARLCELANGKVIAPGATHSMALGRGHGDGPVRRADH